MSRILPLARVEMNRLNLIFLLAFMLLAFPTASMAQQNPPYCRPGSQSLRS